MDIKINDGDKVTMTHTGLLPGKSGKVIHVCFERKMDGRDDYAEIVLQLYLKEQEKSIIKNAKQINHDLIYKL